MNQHLSMAPVKTFVPTSGVKFILLRAVNRENEAIASDCADFSTPAAKSRG